LGDTTKAHVPGPSRSLNTLVRNIDFEQGLTLQTRLEN